MKAPAAGHPLPKGEGRDPIRHDHSKGEAVSELEKLRLSYRPQQITTLFVGESPPHNGTFFYEGNSRLFREMKKVFGDSAGFLSEFKANGFFLDDLVLDPINDKEKAERKDHRREGVPSLAQRMKDYQPSAVVALMCAIGPMVREAMCRAGLSHLPLHVTPFPAFGNEKRFRARMAEIIPKIL